MSVYISLGGNFENSDLLILQAIEELELCDQIKNMQVSRMHSTDPVDIVDSEAKFKNVCVGFDTDLTAEELFDLTEEIEEELGKAPKPKNVSRPIDIDILFFKDELIETERLCVPHPKWQERSFVIAPLLELTDSVYDPKTKQTIDLSSLLEERQLQPQG